MGEKSSLKTLIELTADIVSAHIAHNAVPPSGTLMKLFLGDGSVIF